MGTVDAVSKPGHFVSLCRFGLRAALIVSGQAAFADIDTDPPIDCRSCEQWNQPQAPYRIFGSTYYVGTAGLSVILIDAGDSLVLLDGGLPQSVPQITANIRALGFALENVRVIGLSHAHYDHAGGIAALQRASGARVVASRHAAETLMSGELLEDDPQFGSDTTAFPATLFVEVLEDGGRINLGNLEITAIYTPGHTPGGTSWTWPACEGLRCRQVVYADSLGPAAPDSYRFSDGMATSIRESARKISDLECDILLSPHPFLFDMNEKLEQGVDSFIDGNECEAYARRALEQLERRSQREQQEP